MLNYSQSKIDNLVLFYFSWKGRVTRKQFWLYYFIPFNLIFALMVFLDYMAGQRLAVDGNNLLIVTSIKTILFWASGFGLHIVPLFILPKLFQLAEFLNFHPTNRPHPGISTLLFSALMIYVSIVIGIKRLHDRNKSGTHILFFFIPYIGSIWWLIFCGILPGSKEVDRFKPNPKDHKNHDQSNH